MEKKKKEKVVEYLHFTLIGVAGVGILGATIVCFWRFIVAPDWSQKLLAVSVLVPIWLGVFNMLKWLRSSGEFTELSKKLDKLIKVKEKEMVQTREIEEQRRKDEREPAKKLLESRLNDYVSYWVEHKESLLEGDKKRRKELREKLFEIGNGLKKKVDEKEDLLPQPVVRKAKDIANDIIKLSNKITYEMVVNEDIERTKRINQKLIEEGDKLAKRAKELIEELQRDEKK